MGYGGEVKNSGIVTQLSNDGGIDGIIKEDILDSIIFPYRPNDTL